jgi:predicted transcriptional regulator
MPTMDGRAALPSPSEWQVFACLSRWGPCPLQELERKLPRLRRYTIETLLLRLAEKGYASTRDDAGRYRALVPFEEALQAQVDRFLETFIGADREACAQLIRQAEEHWNALVP